MQIEIKAFGIAKEIFGASSITADMHGNATIAQLRKMLEEKYPRLATLASYAIAVNDEYAQADLIITNKDDIAIIPPVSGG